MSRKKKMPALAVYRPVEVLDAASLFAPVPLLPGEDAEAYRRLHDALSAQHRPRSTYEKYLVAQLAEAEWNILRRAAWVSELIAAKAEDLAIRHLSRAGLPMVQARAAAQTWRASLGGAEATADISIEAQGIRSATLLAEARAGLHSLILDLEAENRRARQDIRLLQADLASLRRNSPAPEEADICNAP